ncbi:MAG: glycoside hydrolase family 2 TIM barrel-domain containing protein [Janthinobacterium lividum]
MHKNRFLLFLLTLLTTPAAAQRLVQSIDSDWQFRPDSVARTPAQAAAGAGWQPVSLPHTWNAQDVSDDVPGYYRGAGWYRKVLRLPAAWQARRVFLRFEGAGQQAEVWVNGQPAGRHAGGYTAFVVPVSAYVAADGRAEVLVQVSNQHDADVPPLSADFTFFGGLYRSVYLVAVAPAHFELSDHGGPGVAVSTPQVTAQAATVAVAASLRNEGAAPRRLRLRTQVLDSAGRVVASQQVRVVLPGGASQVVQLRLPPLAQPRLWSPARPYLYRTISQVLAGDTVLDEVSTPLGVRWFRFDAATGFYLNGQPLKLIGASRHQDYPGLGNAVPPALAGRDVALLKAMGGNFLRVAHYPQDPAVLEACDRLGLLASVEIPVVNAITDSPAFFENCRRMQTEMVQQNRNHPSVVLWAYMNEVLLRLPAGIKRDNDAGRAYLGRVRALAGQLDSLTHRLDPGRATMLACHGDLALYQQAGLLTVPQVLGWNLYQGWYGGELGGFAAFLDRHHRELPTVPLLVTEYGADARLHAATPRRFDKTEEYAARYHQAYLPAILARPFVAGGAVWNLADFSSETRQEANPHLNTKGLLTATRQPKAPYYYYQTQLSANRTGRIASRNWTLRAGVAVSDDSLVCPQLVEVYTNQPAVRLRLNGDDLGLHPAPGGVACFRVPFVDGRNLLVVNTPDGVATDEATVEFQLLPRRLADPRLPFCELSVSLGDERTFTDEQLRQVWLPEQPYAPGGWGYVGGHVFKLPGERLPYGSDRDVLGTDLDAVYETQRLGLQAFRLDVPDGEYEVTLHLAELEAAPAGAQLAYNLAGEQASGSAAPASRRFEVLMNGQLVLPGLGGAALPPLRAISYRVPVSVRGSQGLELTFRAQAGEACLNGLQVRRVQ